MSQDMRILMTRRMLKEGLLRKIEHKPLSRISVSELCKEAGVNRATFYNHYDSPTMLLKDIAEDYSKALKNIYYTNFKGQERLKEQAILACLTYLYEKKDEIKILFSPNAENSINGFGLEILQNRLLDEQDSLNKALPGSYADHFLTAVLASSAAYGLIKVWLVNDINKTPEEIIDMLKQSFGSSVFSSAPAP